MRFSRALLFGVRLLRQGHVLPTGVRAIVYVLQGPSQIFILTAADSYSLSSCKPNAVCQSQTTTFTSLDRVQTNATKWNGNVTAYDWVGEWSARLSRSCGLGADRQSTRARSSRLRRAHDSRSTRRTVSALRVTCVCCPFAELLKVVLRSHRRAMCTTARSTSSWVRSPSILSLIHI